MTLHGEKWGTVNQQWGAASKCHVGASSAPFVSRVLAAISVCARMRVREMHPPPSPSGLPNDKGWRPGLVLTPLYPSHEFFIYIHILLIF